MSTTNCPTGDARDSLSRDSLIPAEPGERMFLARLVIGALAGLALAVVASIPGEPPEGDTFSQRAQATGAAASPAPVDRPALDGRGKWTGYTR
ncbi:MAG: hypothetical protein Tsb0032_29120 [Kiloniellaceae bacterium]